MRPFISIFKDENQGITDPGPSSSRFTDRQIKSSSSTKHTDIYVCSHSVPQNNQSNICVYPTTTLSEYLENETKGATLGPNKRSHLDTHLDDTDQNMKCVRDSCAKSGDINCYICLEKIEMDCEIRNIPCSHMFHKECLDAWATRSSDSNTESWVFRGSDFCPMCRFKLITHQPHIRKNNEPTHPILEFTKF